MQKGAVNVAGDWNGGLQKPNGLNARQRPRAAGRVTTGATVNHEGQTCPSTIKLVFETSVRT
jgi:hypothetical protein